MEIILLKKIILFLPHPNGIAGTWGGILTSFSSNSPGFSLFYVDHSKSALCILAVQKHKVNSTPHSHHPPPHHHHLCHLVFPEQLQLSHGEQVVVGRPDLQGEILGWLRLWPARSSRGWIGCLYVHRQIFNERMSWYFYIARSTRGNIWKETFYKN